MTVESDRGIFRQASAVVEKYIQQQFDDLGAALGRIENIQQHVGCCCPSCTKEAMSEANQLMWWCYSPYLDDSALDELNFSIDAHGNIQQGIPTLNKLEVVGKDSEGTIFLSPGGAKSGPLTPAA